MTLTGAALSDRFTSLRLIGRGGMGVVYEAYDVEHGARVALKTLERLDASNVYQLKNEFRALADLRHPNLVRLYELFGRDGQWFFSMELLEGERFDAWVRTDGRLDKARLLAALSQLTAAVGAVHAAGKLHRDLKPSNVLVTHAGRLVLLDFGLVADPNPGGMGQTLTDQGVSGTPAYMAPEQAAGLPATAASDVYAIGTMLFEALTHRLPFEGRALEGLLAKQVDDAPRVRALQPDVDEELGALCDAMLARDPQCRPPLASLSALLGDRVPDAPAISQHRALASPLVGRELELERLQTAFRASLAGSAVVTLVSGESGMGKTSLVETFLAELRDRAAVVFTGRCHERENVPFKGFDALVDALSRHLRRLPPDRAAALLPREAFAAARLFPVLQRVPVVADAPTKHVPDPHDLRRRGFDALCEVLERIRDRQPLALFIDDLQSIDPDSLQLLRHLLARAEPAPLLLILAYRSEDAAVSPRLRAVIETAESMPTLSQARIEVGPLHDDALERLVARHTAADCARAIAREARGSPFFGIELAKATLLLPGNDAPPTIEEALGVRMDALGDTARSVLSVLALAGKPLALGLVAETVRQGAAHAVFGELANERLVRASGDDARAIECYHDRIRQAILARLDAANVRELSSRLADVLSTRGDDPELLTRSLLAAGRSHEAAREAARSAGQSMEQLAFERAVRLYEQAFAFGAFAPDELQTLRVARAAALAYAGRGVEAAEAYLEASQTATGEDAVALARTAGEQYLLCGRLERGRELVAAALRAHGVVLPSTQAGATASLVWSRARLRWRGLRFAPKREHDPNLVRRLELMRAIGHCLVRSDQLRSADLSARLLLLALEHGHTLELARCLSSELELSGLLGTPRELAEALVSLADSLSTSTGDALARQMFHLGRAGYHAWMKCDLERAVADSERYLELSTQHPQVTHSYDRSWAAFHKAYALCMLGRGVEALKVAQVQLEEARSRGDATVLPAWVWIECCVLPAVGEIDRAERELAEIRSSWQTRDVTAQSVLILASEYLVAMYRGEPQRMWQATEVHRERLDRSLLAKAPIGHSSAALCCVAAASGATRLPASAERAAWVREMTRYARRARRPIPTLAPPIAPAMACARGEPEAAIEALHAALRTPELPPIFEQSARRRLGVLVGGETGRALVAQADAFFTSHGVRDPERYTAMVMPGVEL